MAKRKTRGLYHGYVVIDKPAGWTSHDVVGKVRRIVGERRVGHAGTLDPAAVGVLPIAIGLATRTVEYLSEASKAYVADITFGVTTDSADIDGSVVRVQDASPVTESVVVEALARFEGHMMQVPPMHSAIRVGGERLYERARRGEEADVPARPVTIHDTALEAWEWPVARVSVSCSKGTYIRSLARDLGEAVGTGAYLSHLVRVRTGPFTSADAIQIDELEASMQTVPWEQIAFHPDMALLDRSVVILDHQRAAAWKHGKSIEAEGVTSLVRVYDVFGTWLGVGKGDEHGTTMWPVKVVADME